MRRAAATAPAGPSRPQPDPITMTPARPPPTEAAQPPGDARPAPPPEPAPPVAGGFPIVGLGASAGGLAAFEAFFSGMPAGVEPGMAFVLVQHLAPDHESLLTELIQRTTRMPVVEVADGMVVQPNCVYIIPPNRDMAFLNGALHLLEPVAPRGHRLPVDYLFRSLAQDQRERAIGIVLSGTGSDGTLGVRAIKGAGGMVMAQDPSSCEFDGMPRSALHTGLVDFELAPGRMPVQLLAYVAHAFGTLPPPIAAGAPQNESALKKIFVLLRAQTGHDFSQYKPSTIHRRIERRLAVHQITGMDAYVKYLQQAPAEVEALFRDLLIGVTSFFRDPEAFKALEEKAIPQLLDDRPPASMIRAWCTACSTGDEAYSIAILLQEGMEARRQSHKVQVFATDIDSRAIATARTGVYPASIVDEVSQERLARFFTAEADGTAWRVQKSLRDMLVFSEHNAVKDPPFSKLDLISCRNLLIYMGADLQKKLLALFHYALNPGGLLFLGTSETVGELGDLFAVVDRKSKLYQRKEDFQGVKRAALGRFLPPTTGREVARLPGDGKTGSPAKLSLRELTEQAILQKVAPAGALVNQQGDILYLHGRTGMFLEPTPGETGVSNILRMAREGLRRELTTALHKAAVSQAPVQAHGLQVKTNGHFTAVDLAVFPVMASPAAGPESPLYLVMLHEAPTSAVATGHRPATLPLAQTPPDQQDVSTQLAALNEELQAKERTLQAANEELEASNEELKSFTEEMQSVNEELQSTNEEMETSKEELQSINEELATVNTELQTKVGDLSRANNDMNNLLAGTGIGTVFLDMQMRILRFTPAATLIINLIPSDIGRPVGHIVANLVGYDQLIPDVQGVLDSLNSRELDVRTRDGKWYTLRILPYRTLDNVIEGVVMTFVDITEVVLAREALRKANESMRLAVVVRDAQDAITVQDLQGRILAWNPGAIRIYGWSEAEALAMNVRDRIPPGLQEDALARARQLSQTHLLAPCRTQRLCRDGRVVDVHITATALVNEVGTVYAIATTERPRAPAMDLPQGVPDAHPIP